MDYPAVKSAIEYIKKVCEVERARLAPANMDGPFIGILGSIKCIEKEVEEFKPSIADLQNVLYHINGVDQVNFHDNIIHVKMHGMILDRFLDQCPLYVRHMLIRLPLGADFALPITELEDAIYEAKEYLENNPNDLIKRDS